MAKPNVLFIMTDQQRADTIAALGNADIETPNYDRLVRRGVSFSNGYSTCPVCVPARYTVRTGCEPLRTGIFQNGRPTPETGQADTIEGRCGTYLAKTMRDLGYRTFGIGKFHSIPWNEDLGFDVHLHTEELFGTPEQRQQDAFAGFIAREHPEYDFIEGLHGERTEMYYMPQMSPLPAGLTVESFVADRTLEQLAVDDPRPYFGFVSFIGPHPPFAPPIPYNRLYDPDKMPNPIRGDLAIDHMDEQIPFMNYMIWANEINDFLARVLKARYYAEITYIDDCIGRILDAVEARPDAENTVICMFADHGDHMGDHTAWQKESFFDAACRVPFLVSWPSHLPKNVRRDDLVCLTDLFGIATTAAGSGDTRDGIDVLSLLETGSGSRDYLFGYYGEPGTPQFKIMVRSPEWKYVYFANGGSEQLFNLRDDPHELCQMASSRQDVVVEHRQAAVKALQTEGGQRALENHDLKSFAFAERPRFRIKQFDASRGVRDFTVNQRTQ